MRKVFFLVIFTTVSLCVSAQLTTNEQPYGLQHRSTGQRSQNQIVLPPPDVRQLLIEDSISKQSQVTKDSISGQVLNSGTCFAYPVLVNYTPYNSGVWEQLPNGDKIWRLKIKIPDALSTHTYYDSFWLPDSCKFFVYSEETKQSIGAITSEFIKGSKNEPIQFATALIFGESVVYEYYQPASVSDTAIIYIDRIDYGYRNIRNSYQSGSKGIGNAHPCNEDICNTTDFQQERNAVTMIVVRTSNRSSSYTGYLINNTNNDNTPYVITTLVTYRHQVSPAQWMFYWDYSDCGDVNLLTVGADVVARNTKHFYDFGFLLLRLPSNQDPQNLQGFTPYYLGWDRYDNDITQMGACIHHPMGDYKKYGRFNSIQTYNHIDSPFPVGSVWVANFNFGFVGEVGSSSGAPLLDANNRMIGTFLTYDTSSVCSNYKAVAEKLSNAWTGGGTANPQNRLMDWLDPCNMGATTCDGITGNYNVQGGIVSTTTWNTNKRVHGDITIPNGVTLTITSEVKLDENVKITVQPGGKLIVDGGILTWSDVCGIRDGLWRGIEIVGNAKKVQNAINQGVVELKNNAKIMFAFCGVHIGSGGILKADSTYFTNNRQAAYFAPYRNNANSNLSYFNACTINLYPESAPYLLTLSVNAQIELQGVNGIKFTNCTFVDYRTEYYMLHVHDLTNAIYANESSIQVNPILPYPSIGASRVPINAGCKFSGFNKGICIVNLGNNNPSLIYSSNFENNCIGIALEGVTNTSIAYNQFTISRSLIYGIGDERIGVYLCGSSFYNIYNNTFLGMDSCQFRFGIYMDNSGEGNHYIKNNTFKNLDLACYIFGRNSDNDTTIQSRGLVFLCNSFQNNWGDIQSFGQIRHIQSAGNLLATGNVFLNSSFTWNINSFHPIRYYYLSSDPFHQHQPTKINNVSLIPTNKHSCMFFGAGNIFFHPYHKFTIASNDDIHSFDPNNYYARINEIYEAKKIESLEKGYHNTPLNWQDSIVMDIVEQLIMDDDYIVTINGNPPSTDLENQIAMFYELTHLKQQMDNVCYAVLEILANNEEGLDIVEYRKWMGRFNTIESEYVLAESYMSVGEFENAEEILDSIPIKYPNLDEESYHNYLDYFAVIQEYSTLNDDEEMPSDLIDELIRLSDNSDFVAIKARSFGEMAVVNWSEYYPYTFAVHSACVCNTNEIFDQIDRGGQKNAGNPQKDIQSIEDKEYTLSTYPNPFRNTLQIRLDNASDLNISQVHVYDITGRMLYTMDNIGKTQTEIELSNLSLGIYFVHVFLTNGETKVTRVIKE